MRQKAASSLTLQQCPGDWAGYRECHIKPDLLLIYRKSDADTLRLARLGSHSELFG
nr:type II toxin-antitoxin system YafQ family toxin [Klebsiella pneumoniae]